MNSVKCTVYAEAEAYWGGGAEKVNDVTYKAIKFFFLLNLKFLNNRFTHNFSFLDPIINRARILV